MNQQNGLYVWGFFAHLFLFHDQTHPRDRRLYIIRNAGEIDTDHLLFFFQITQVIRIRYRNLENPEKAQKRYKLLILLLSFPKQLPLSLRFILINFLSCLCISAVIWTLPIPKNMNKLDTNLFPGLWKVQQLPDYFCKLFQAWWHVQVRAIWRGLSHGPSRSDVLPLLIPVLCLGSPFVVYTHTKYEALLCQTLLKTLEGLTRWKE